MLLLLAGPQAAPYMALRWLTVKFVCLPTPCRLQQQRIACQVRVCWLLLQIHLQTCSKALICSLGMRHSGVKGGPAFQMPADQGQRDHSEGAGSTVSSFLRDQRTIWSHPVYALAVAGSAVYTGDLADHDVGPSTPN